MKLELKHLAGYLPYGLKGISTEENLGIETVKGLNYYGKHNTVNVVTDVDDIDLILFKPILRPLSDLTKEIEVNGEKFVPSQEYNYLRFEEISTFKGRCNAMKFIQARELELLYEMHFDIYGLIPDLAIDINTLEK